MKANGRLEVTKIPDLQTTAIKKAMYINRLSTTIQPIMANSKTQPKIIEVDRLKDNRIKTIIVPLEVKDSIQVKETRLTNNSNSNHKHNHNSSIIAHTPEKVETKNQ